MDNIFSEKPWVEPLSVAGTSCDIDSGSSSTEETREKFGNETYIIIRILQFVTMYFKYSNVAYSKFLKYIFS